MALSVDADKYRHSFLQYIPRTWNIMKMIMIYKLGNSAEDIGSIISLLPIASKIFENVISQRFRIVIADKYLIPDV